MPGIRAGVIGNARIVATPSADQGTSVASQAFGSGATNTSQSGTHPLAPVHAFGIRFWLGVTGLVALVWIYHSLPE